MGDKMKIALCLAVLIAVAVSAPGTWDNIGKSFDRTANDLIPKTEEERARDALNYAEEDASGTATATPYSATATPAPSRVASQPRRPTGWSWRASSSAAAASVVAALRPAVGGTSQSNGLGLRIRR